MAATVAVCAISVAAAVTVMVSVTLAIAIFTFSGTVAPISTRTGVCLRVWNPLNSKVTV